MNRPLHHTIAGSVALLAWKLLEFYGKDPTQCFEAGGFKKEQLEDPEFRMDHEAYDQIWDCAHSKIDDPCAGLNVVHFWHPTILGVLGYAMLSSNTIRESLQRLVRYQQVVSEDSKITLTSTDEGLLVQQNHIRHQTDKYPLEVDSFLSLLLHICRFNYVDSLDPVEVNLMCSRPEAAGRYYAFYRCPVNFSAAANNIVLPSDVLDNPLPAISQQLAQMHDRVLQNCLASQQRSEMATRVREIIIAHLPSGETNMDQVANKLLMGTRTMQRRLQDEGSSFIDVLNETRQDLAMQYIQDDNLPIKEISYLLGFSDSTAFSRAFKRWTGKAPNTIKPG